jgi:sugar O-acyltransferase (sialic acid O-acetyltransferase NeuD family)
MSQTPAPHNLLVLGFGGHARSVGDVALAAGVKRLLFVDPQTRPNESFAGFPVHAKLRRDLAGDWWAFSALGDNGLREQQCVSAPFPLATLISPDATIGIEVEIGPGTFVARKAHVGPLAKIGTGVILNTGSIVDHESIVGDYTHISVNSTVAGRCRIGRHVMLGAGAVVIDNVSICDDVIVGAGAAVVTDITESGTYVGIPARCVTGG